VEVTGFLVGVELVGATLSLLPRETFIRGDFNDDGVVTSPDAIDLLDHLFGDAPGSLCPATADVNGSGATDLGDPIKILAYLFLGGDDPVPPFPSCDFDLAEDASCPRQDSCP
jgi:hypothetical protein